MLSDLARAWTDSLTTVAVGSLTVLVPAVTQTDPDGSLSMHFGDIPRIFRLVNEVDAAGIAILLIVFLGATFAVGATVIQFGEFLSILPDIRKGRSTHLKRVARAASNSIYAMIYANAYTSFRLLCGIGTFLIISGLFLIVSGAANISIQYLFSGLVATNLGISFVFIFARYSFTYIDWLVAGDLTP